MPNRSPFSWTRLLSQADGIAVPIAVLGILGALIVPLPPFLLDVLVSANISLSAVILLSAMFIRRPAEFNVFPTTLLLMTLFRLALNVSSSRLILLNGSRGTSAAGEVIESFGNFVVGGNYVIGAVIFLVLIAIQYVVINHGAVRISEVTARFTLDALPGKQMSIDADLNAGLIQEAEAKSRRKALTMEAEFYGAMDGASRFTQRDAVASILITAINIVAGFLVGVLQHDMPLAQALQTYTVLTIGDGLVTVIPALMISISGGLIVTRASSDERISHDFRRQIFGAAEPLYLASALLIGMALFPGLPKLPFLLMGGVVGLTAMKTRARQTTAETEAPAAARQAPEDLNQLLRVDLLAIEVGIGLVGLVEGGSESPLLRRLAAIRRQVALDLGYILPPVRVTDNLRLKPREYAVLLRGNEITRFELPAGQHLVLGAEGTPPPDGGVPVKEPAFGIPAYWVPSSRAETLRAAGQTVVDPQTVMGTHLSELIRRHAHELLTRQNAKSMLDRIGQEQSKLVEDVVPKLLPLSTVHRVLQLLLKERVSIRDTESILEALGEAAGLTRNPVLLVEYVRQALRRSLAKPLVNERAEIPAYFLDPSIEIEIDKAVEHGELSSHLNLPPQRSRSISDAIVSAVGRAAQSPVLITGSSCRTFVRQLVEPVAPHLTVLSHGEIPEGVRVLSAGIVKEGVYLK